MNLDKQFKQILEKTKILKNPKHRLSTFGQTKIDYFFLSEVSGFTDRSRLRKGTVISEKPQIITLDFLKNRFEGFGNEAEEFGNWLKEIYGDSFRGLEYKFRNESLSAHIEYSSLKLLTERIKKRSDHEELSRTAIIQGPDSTWQISLMKFILDECQSSFTSNIKDLDEHGFFDNPEKVFKERKKEIEELFSRAKQDCKIVSLLGRKLHLYDLFKEYEDRFFQLMKRS